MESTTNGFDLLPRLAELYRNLPLDDRLNVKRFIDHDLGEITFSLALAEAIRINKQIVDDLKALRGAK